MTVHSRAVEVIEQIVSMSELVESLHVVKRYCMIDLRHLTRNCEANTKSKTFWRKNKSARRCTLYKRQDDQCTDKEWLRVSAVKLQMYRDPLDYRSSDNTM